MTQYEIEKFVEDNIDSIIEAACSFPFKETVDAIIAAAEKANIPKRAVNLIALAAFDAAYMAAEDAGFDKAVALIANDVENLTDTDFDACMDAIQKQLDDTKLEPYVGDEYNQFQ